MSHLLEERTRSLISVVEGAEGRPGKANAAIKQSIDDARAAVQAATDATTAVIAGLAGKAPADILTTGAYAARGPIKRTLVQRAGDVIDAKEFLSGDGSPENAAAQADLITAVNTAPGRVTLDLKRGRYNLAGAGLQFQRGLLRVVGDGAELFSTQMPPASDGAAPPSLLSFQAAPNPAPFETVALADIYRLQEAITVASAAGFRVGDWVEVKSTEYHSGIGTTSGYRRKSKGEFAQIKAVSGNTIYIDYGARDDYKVAGEVVRIVKIPMYYDCGIEGGLYFEGAGRGQDWLGSTNPTSPRGVGFYGIVDPCILPGAQFRNFSRFGAILRKCVDFRIVAPHFIGRDLRDATNAGQQQPVWFTGIYAEECSGGILHHGTARGLRRLFDADSGTAIGDSTITRNITVSGGSAQDCYQLAGCHTAENVTFSNLTGTNLNSGIAFRGKHCTIANVRIRNAQNYAVRLGIARDASYGGDDGDGDGVADYADPTSVGCVTITGLDVDHARYGVYLSADVERLILNGCEMSRLSDYAVLSRVQRIGRLSIQGGLMDLSRSNLGRPAVLIANDLMKEIGQFEMRGVTVRNAWRGVAIEGVADGYPAAGLISIEDNTFATIEKEAVWLGRLAYAEGNFGADTVIRNNRWGGAWPTPVAITAPHRHLRQPTIAGNIWPSSPRLPAGIGAALPTLQGATYEVGQEWIIDPPSALSWEKFAVRRSGTTGTLARTGSVSLAAPTTLTIDQADAIGPGTRLQIAGAGVAGAVLVAKALAVSSNGLVVTLDTAAGTAVTNAAVTYSPPLWYGSGQYRTSPAPVANEETESVLACFLTTPSNARIALIDATIGQLKSAGLWAKMVRLWVLAAHDAQAGLVDWKTLAVLQPVNAPGHLANVGYASNGTDSYLLTSHAPTLAGATNYAMGVWSESDVANSGYLIGNHIFAICPRAGNNEFRTRHGSGAANNSATAVGNGFHLISRSVPENYQRYRNAVAQTQADQALSTSASAVPVWICGQNFPGAPTFNPSRVSIACIASALSPAEVTSLHGILNAYRIGVGLT